MPKKVKKELLVTAIATLSDDVVDDRHYIVNSQPECISFWSLTARLSQIKASQLIDLIRLGVDSTVAATCGGTCTTTVVCNTYTTRKAAKRTVKSPECDNKCIVNIKRVL